MVKDEGEARRALKLHCKYHIGSRPGLPQGNEINCETRKTQIDIWKVFVVQKSKHTSELLFDKE